MYATDIYGCCFFHHTTLPPGDTIKGLHVNNLYPFSTDPVGFFRLTLTAARFS